MQTTIFPEEKRSFPSTIVFLLATLLLSLNFVRPFGLAISDWLYFVAIIFAFLETLSIDRMNFECWIKNKLLWPSWIILIGALLSTFRSVNVLLSVFEIIQVIFVLTLFISLIWIMVRRGQSEKIINAFILSGLFAASVAVYDYLSGANVGQILSATPGLNLWGRYAGPLRHPNKLGYFLVLTATLTLIKWIKAEKGRHSFAFGLSFGIHIFAIYLSGSITAYLGIILSLVVLIITSQQVRMKLSKYHFLILLLVIVIPLTLLNNHNSLPEIIFAGVLRNVDRVLNITTGTRLDIFKLAITSITSNPLFGVGYDQFSTSDLDSLYSLLPGTVHNIFLQMLYSGGLVAFFVLFGVYTYLGIEALKSLSNKRYKFLLLAGTAASVLSLILMDQFQDMIYQREKWLTIGLFLGLVWSFGERKDSEIITFTKPTDD